MRSQPRVWTSALALVLGCAGAQPPPAGGGLPLPQPQPAALRLAPAEHTQDDAADPALAPRPIGGGDLGEVVAVAAAGDRTCVLPRGRPPRCWGRAWDPTHDSSGGAAVSLTGLSSLATSRAHSCGLTQRGTVSCWGDGRAGELGQGPPPPPPPPPRPPRRVPPGKIVVDCWGSSEGSAPPNPSLPMERLVSPVPHVAGATSVAVAAGVSCALTRRGAACWGTPASRVGSDEPASDGLRAAAPVTLAHLRCDAFGPPSAACAEAKRPVWLRATAGAESLVAVGSHACVLFPTGRVACADIEDLSAARVGFPSPEAVVVAAIGGAKMLRATAQRACVIDEAGALACFDPRAGAGAIPALEVRLTAPVVDFAESAGTPDGVAGHACAVTADGRVSCWGRGDRGQLGDGRRITFRAEPAAVDGIDDAVAVAVGASHGCALRRGGEVWCWGASLDHASRAVERANRPSLGD